MRFHHTFALALLAALSACTAAQDRRLQDKSPDWQPATEPAPKAADPMAPAARLVGGEWRVRFQSGTSMYDAFHWGPGRHSVRAMTHGDDAAGNPWRALGVTYWHPGRRQVRSLGLSPFERSMAEGTVTFDAETSEAVSDLYQTGVRRRIVQRSVFEGPDKFHVTLLEAIPPIGPAGPASPAQLTKLVEWDYVRSMTLTPVRPIPADKAPKFPERLKPLEPLQGHIWETTGEAEGVGSGPADPGAAAGERGRSAPCCPPSRGSPSPTASTRACWR